MIRLARAEDSPAIDAPPWGRGLNPVAPDIAALALSLVNVAFVGEPGAPDRAWVLVDAGLSTSAAAILGAAARRFGPDSRPAAILLTHGHFDHVGALARLARRWDAPIYAHRLEFPYLTGRSPYPPPDPAAGGGMMSLLSPFYSRGPIDVSDRLRELPADGSVPGLPDWRWIHTPGHAPGHVAFYREQDGMLLAGDAFVTIAQESALAVLTQADPHVRRPPAYFTPDWEAARESVEALADLRPELALTGHGPPLDGDDLRRGLGALLASWDRSAVPSHGRYARRPARTGLAGVEWVPPPAIDPRTGLAVTLGLGALSGFLLARALRPRAPLVSRRAGSSARP